MGDKLSTFVTEGKPTKASHLIRSTQWLEGKPYENIPSGAWGSKAIITSTAVSNAGEAVQININSDEIDFEFNVSFDDNLESNEGDITIYNLTDYTISLFGTKQAITIKAGFGDDLGVVFNGYITKVKTTYDGVDKVTTLKIVDDIPSKDNYTKSFSEGTTASTILKTLLEATGLPIRIFDVRRDHTYENAVDIDEPLESAIKTYSNVCGVSTFSRLGYLYSVYLKDTVSGDVYYDKNGNATGTVGFIVSEDTGMIGSPSSYEEEETYEDYTETVKGYEIEMLLQHRISTASKINLRCREVAHGGFTVRSGEHIFNGSEAITKIKVF